MVRTKKLVKPIIGWREWISLPDLNVKAIKVKVDSGAKTSALHASSMEFFRKNNKEYVRFVIYPNQKNRHSHLTREVKIHEHRWVTSSNGHRSLRPVIKTNYKIGIYEFSMELTLVNRDIMGFRMLLGRDGFKEHFLLDASHSYLVGKKKRRKA